MKSFNLFKKATCLIISLIIALTSLAGCGGLGKPLLTLDGTEMSVNLFELYLSRMKGTLCSAEFFGESAKSSDFWETWIDVYEKKTYNTYYTEFVLDSAKSYTAALAAFDKLELELPKSYIDEIDAKLKELLENDANGSKTAFNAILADYGANYDILREAYIIDAKTSYLKEHLFGKNGSKVGANIIDEYYKDNYARFKQVFLYAYEFRYEEDENGDKIYFKSGGERISYDTTQTPKLDDKGVHVADANGDRIYVYTDGEGKERIAYSKEGASTKQKYDSNGAPMVRYFEDGSKEMNALNSDADAIFAEAEKGNFEGFDALVTEYNQEEGSEVYPNGYYVSQTTAYEATEVITEVFNMEVGEVKKIPSDHGIHIVMRYELEEGAYTFEENEDLFISSKTGTYTFMSRLVEELLSEYLKDDKERVVVKEELIKNIDIKNAGVNFYY